MKMNLIGHLSNSCKVIHSELVMNADHEKNLFNADLYLHIYEGFFGQEDFNKHLCYESIVCKNTIEEYSNGVSIKLFENFNDIVDKEDLTYHDRPKPNILKCYQTKYFDLEKEYFRKFVFNVRPGLDVILKMEKKKQFTKDGKSFYFYQLTSRIFISVDEFKKILVNSNKSFVG